MDKAVVFSKVYRIGFAEFLAKQQAENLLKDFLNSVGEPLTYNQIILGHIKMVARVPENQEFLFLSMTQLDQLDVKQSAGWSYEGFTKVRNMELDINVLIFGYSRIKVEMVVQNSLRKLLHNFKGQLVGRDR